MKIPKGKFTYNEFKLLYIKSILAIDPYMDIVELTNLEEVRADYVIFK